MILIKNGDQDKMKRNVKEIYQDIYNNYIKNHCIDWDRFNECYM